MAKRMAPEVKRYFKAARLHFGDAKVLVKASRANGCIYLAGYAVECALKALLLSCVPPAGQRALSGSFRGRDWHSYDHLKEELRRKGVSAPDDINRQLTTVNTWSVEMRYAPVKRRKADAVAILGATKEIVRWVQRTIT